MKLKTINVFKVQLKCDLKVKTPAVVFKLKPEIAVCHDSDASKR